MCTSATGVRAEVVMPKTLELGAVGDHSASAQPSWGVVVDSPRRNTDESAYSAQDLHPPRPHALPARENRLDRRVDIVRRRCRIGDAEAQDTLAPP